MNSGGWRQTKGMRRSFRAEILGILLMSARQVYLKTGPSVFCGSETEVGCGWWIGVCNVDVCGVHSFISRQHSSVLESVKCKCPGLNVGRQREKKQEFSPFFLPTLMHFLLAVLNYVHYYIITFFQLLENETRSFIHHTTPSLFFFSPPFPNKVPAATWLPSAIHFITQRHLKLEPVARN